MIKRGGWCPTKHCVEPPVYGDSILKKCKQKKSNNNEPTQKIYNTPRSDREDEDRESFKDEPAECKNFAWRSSIPRGNTVCFKVGSTLKDASISPELNECRKNVGNEKERNTRYSLIPPSPSTLWKPVGYCSRNTIQPKSKQFYNIMWDPRVCRGEPTVHFSAHQKEKCRKELDLNRWINFRSVSKNRTKKRKEKGGDYLDKRSNPTGRILYPPVHIEKEPLTYQSFAPFLTDMSEGPEFVDRAQCMSNNEEIGKEIGPNKGVNVLVGTEEGTQTASEPCEEETTNYIVKTILEKVPQQALLELGEETEMEVMMGERKRYEMVFLFRKWQQMKEDQWNEWLYQWNEIRMNSILEENMDFEETEERICAIGFAKCAMDACLRETAYKMKIDGFINEHGIPYEEIREIEDAFGFSKDVQLNLAAKNKMSEKVVTSVVTQAVVQRFAEHMHHKFGRPHGRWIKRRGRFVSIDYDVDLQTYLEGRWVRRREGPLGSADVRNVKTDFGLLEFLKERDMDLEDVEPQRVTNVNDITKLMKMIDFSAFDEVKKEEKSNIGETETPPPSPSISAINTLDKLLVGKKLGRKTVKKGDSQIVFEENNRSENVGKNSDDLSVLYRRKTSWTKLDKMDDAHKLEKIAEGTRDLQQNPNSSATSAVNAEVVNDDGAEDSGQ